MYETHPHTLDILVADRLQQVRVDLETTRVRRRLRQRHRDRLKERRRP